MRFRRRPNAAPQLPPRPVWNSSRPCVSPTASAAGAVFLQQLPPLATRRLVNSSRRWQAAASSAARRWQPAAAPAAGSPPPRQQLPPLATRRLVNNSRLCVPTPPFLPRAPEWRVPVTLPKLLSVTYPTPLSPAAGAQRCPMLHRGRWHYAWQLPPPGASPSSWAADD